MAEGGRSVGTVKWFSGQKGYGFVSPDEGGEDLFVHQTEIQSEGFRTLREGQRVEFKVDSGEDGRSKAIDVVILARNYSSGDRHGGGYGRGVGRGRGGRSGGGYGGGRGGYGVECYNCGRIGHLARDCYRGSGGDGGYERRGGGGRGRGVLSLTRVSKESARLSGFIPEDCYVGASGLSGFIAGSVLRRKLELNENKRILIIEKNSQHNSEGEEIAVIHKEEAICRFCFKKFEEDNVFMTKCKCDESTLIHEPCAAEWSQRKGNNKCDFCVQDIQNIPVTLSDHSLDTNKKKDKSKRLGCFGS